MKPKLGRQTHIYQAFAADKSLIYGGRDLQKRLNAYQRHGMPSSTHTVDSIRNECPSASSDKVDISESSRTLSSVSSTSNQSISRRKSQPHHRDMEVNSHLSSIMKRPKYSRGYYNGDASLPPAISEEDLCNLLGVSSSGRFVFLESSVGNSLTSGSSMSTNSQDWVPKGVEFCSTVELYTYNKVVVWY
eukprot:scaffold50765_cov45-Cyclotella_meneghiniana.AAC.2